MESSQLQPTLMLGIAGLLPGLQTTLQQFGFLPVPLLPHPLRHVGA